VEVEHSEPYLIELFLCSLNPELLTQLFYLGEPSTLEKSFKFAIVADKQMFRRNTYSWVPDKPKKRTHEDEHRPHPKHYVLSNPSPTNPNSSFPPPQIC
jgi:hypothetical protein